MKKTIIVILILLFCAVLIGIFKPVHAAEPCKIMITTPGGELHLTVGSLNRASEHVISNIEKRDHPAKGNIEIYSNNEACLRDLVEMLEMRGYDCRSIHEPFVESADVWYCLENDAASDYIHLIINN